MKDRGSNLHGGGRGASAPWREAASRYAPEAEGPIAQATAGAAASDAPPPPLVAERAPHVSAPERPAPEQPSRDWVDHLRRIDEARDHAAFAEVFAHFAPRVKAFLMKGGADEARAEECAQDVMATLWRKAGMFDPTRATVSTWVFTIARNRRIDMVRREKRPEPEALPWGPEPEPEAADKLERQQEGARLTEALRNLPEKQRELVRLAYFSDLTHSEIAQTTGLPLGTIKSRIRLALERLRHEMK